MQNYSLKDQVFAIMIGVLALMFIIFWFFIKPTKADYETLVITRDTLRVREAECDALKQQNDETSRKISSLETEIKSVEESFLPVLNNENFEQYLLNLFEEKDCPYLSKVTVENIDCDEVTLPDGTVSIDRLACSRVRLEYAATDGYCVPQYNYSPDLSTYGVVISLGIALFYGYDAQQVLLNVQQNIGNLIEEYTSITVIAVNVKAQRLIH